MTIAVASKISESREASIPGQADVIDSYKNLLEIAEGKLAITSLNAEIWHALAGRLNTHEMLQHWAASLSRRINNAIVVIWLKSADSTEAVLQVCSGSAISEFSCLLQFAQEEVEQVISGNGTRSIADMMHDSRWREQKSLLQSTQVTAMALHPLTLNGTVAGAVGAFFRGNATNGNVCRVKAAAEEMSVAFGIFCSESLLRQANGTLRTLLNCAKLGLIGFDLSGHVTLWNLAAEKTFGWSENEVVGHPLAVFPQETLQHFQEWFSSVVQGQLPQSFELTGRRKGGASVELGISLVPHYDGNNSVVGAIAVIADLSARKNGERQLLLQHRVAQILTQSRELDHAAACLLEATCRNLGWQRGEFWLMNTVSRTAKRSAHWQMPGVAAGPFDGVADEVSLSDEASLPARVYGNRVSIREPGNSPACRDSHRWAKDASGRFQDTVAFPVYLGDGQVAGVLTFSADQIDEPDDQLRETMAVITKHIGTFLQQRQVESALAATEADHRQSQKMEAIGALAGGIAHDFNNLLTVIIGHSEIGIESLPAENPLCELFSEIELAGKRAAALTKQLLAFSRKQVINPVTVNINDRITEIERMLRRLIGENIELDSLAPDLYPVTADPAQIEQIVLNLVVNARDAMPKGGRITIRTASVQIDRPHWADDAKAVQGPFAVLTVADTGCGMDEQTKSRIFEPFFTTKGQGSGTGIGLATVYGIAKQSGGGVTVNSQLNKGTTFQVFLPRARDALLPISVETALGPIPGGTEKVLVIDDQDNVRSVVSAILQVRGYKVREAVDGDTALRICRRPRERPDVIIVDMLMPQMTGQELADRVAEKYPAIKLLLMSSLSDDEMQNLRSGREKLSFLHKPFTSDALARKIREVLDS